MERARKMELGPHLAAVELQSLQGTAPGAEELAEELAGELAGVTLCLASC